MTSIIPYDYTVEVRNRFKGLDLIDRVPDELWNEVHDIVQETGIKTFPMKKKCKKAKWLSGEVLQIAVKRREVKSQGEKERYKHLNAEFQRIARRDKKAFLSDQCKEIEENNRIGKTRDLFKIIRDTKGTFHAKMGSIKDRNGMDLTEAEDIKKRWQEYTEKLYKKDLHDPDNHDDVITNLEPDILECEVKWALESITTNKASGGDGIPVELFQILKDDAVKVLSARVNVDILGISKLKWTGMGEFNSDDHYICYCGQKSFKKNGVAIIVNKRVLNAILGCNLKNDRMISVHFQVKLFSIMVIQVYALTSNAEDAEVERFYEDLQELLELTSQKRCPFHYRGLGMQK